MKEWIKELCPEIADWQADLIAEAAQKQVEAEREACWRTAENYDTGSEAAAAIRARGQE